MPTYPFSPCGVDKDGIHTFIPTQFINASGQPLFVCQYDLHPQFLAEYSTDDLRLVTIVKHRR